MSAGSHATLAQEAIASFLERSTRFDPGHLGFLDAQSFDAACTVAVQYDVGARLAERTVAGALEPDHDDVLSASDADYATICQALLKEIGGRFDLLRGLGQQLETVPYATHTERFEFHRGGRRALLVFACATCAGSGAVTCSGCAGSGDNSCGMCGGTGSQSQTRWDTDHNGNSVSSTETVSCSFCFGGRLTCNGCGGSGKETCSTCAGHGKLTRLGSAVLEALPHYRLDSVDPAGDRDVVNALVSYAGLTRLEQHGVRLRQRRVEVVEESRRVLEAADFVCRFSKFRVTANGASARLVVFGEQYRIAEAGPLIESFVRADLDMLRSATAGLRRFDFPMLLYAQKISRLFMLSEVHQAAVSAAAAQGGKAYDFEQLADQLARALTPGYLEQALHHLDIVVKRTSSSYAYGMAAIAAAGGFSVVEHLFSGQRYVAGIAAAAAVFVASGHVRWWLTHFHLRRIGGQGLVDLAAAKGIRRRRKWGW